MRDRAWEPAKARRVLKSELRRRAGGPGMSDATMARLSHLADPEAHATRKAFWIALMRSGASRRRAEELTREVVLSSRTLTRRVGAALRSVLPRLRRWLPIAAPALVLAYVVSGFFPLFLFAFFALLADTLRRHR